MKNIFLRDGKWFGNEFPEAPNIHYYGDNELLYAASYKIACGKVERAKAEALEIKNPEAAPVYLKNEVIPGVLYPWDGGWDIQNYIDDGSGGWMWIESLNELEDIKKTLPNTITKKVLRLLLKSPVSDEVTEQPINTPWVITDREKLWGSCFGLVQNKEDVQITQISVRSCVCRFTYKSSLWKVYLPYEDTRLGVVVLNEDTEKWHEIKSITDFCKRIRMSPTIVSGIVATGAPEFNVRDNAIVVNGTVSGKSSSEILDEFSTLREATGVPEHDELLKTVEPSQHDHLNNALKWTIGIFGIEMAHTTIGSYQVSLNGLGRPWYQFPDNSSVRCESIAEGKQRCQEHYETHKP